MGEIYRPSTPIQLCRSGLSFPVYWWKRLSFSSLNPFLDSHANYVSLKKSCRFYRDFGPLNIAMLYRYVNWISCTLRVLWVKDVGLVSLATLCVLWVKGVGLVSLTPSYPATRAPILI